MRQLRAADAFIAVSTYVKDRSAPYLGDRPVHVIPNFLSPKALAAERDPAGRAALPARYILFLGVLAPFKGVDDLILSFLIAKNRAASLADTHLLLIGPAHPAHRYASDPANNIRVMAPPGRGAVVEAIAGCRCLVAPSRWAEPCPTVVLEGVCAGRPVVGTDVGGIPELLRGVPMAQIVPAQDPRALAQALETACAYDVADAQIGTWHNTPEYLPLQPDRVTQRIVDVYEQAIRQRAGKEVHYAA
jgi:glycosyltransferase involved in cell wall biosynthesis